MNWRLGAAAALALAVSGCTIIPAGSGSTGTGSVPRPPVQTPTPSPTPTPTPPAVQLTTTGNAASAGVMRGPEVSSLQISDEQARRALSAFVTSCPGLLRRNDVSGLTRNADWQQACDAARNAGNAREFFNTQFATVRVANGQSMATGYFEPEIHGCRTRTSQCQSPVYAMPNDLAEIDISSNQQMITDCRASGNICRLPLVGRPGTIVEFDANQFPLSPTGQRFRGRLNGNRLVPYHSRTAIDQGALAGRGLEIAWAADPVELFFLQIQGSGRLRLPDGNVMRIGYAGQNGHTYVGIGRLLADRGVLQPGEASMQGLMSYLRRQSDGGTSVMQENPSWVFFRELTGAGPIGAMGYPVVGRASVAADPNFVPLGAPVFLMMDRSEPNGLWIAQDTGGAIRGSNRFDTFWGAGDEARTIAGGMAARGSAFILVPRSAANRF